MKMPWAVVPAAPQLSVIIPTYNRVEELRLCLEGFSLQTVPREKFEIVVVDDGSTTDVGAVVAPFMKRLKVKLIRTENSGPAMARNIAVANAGAPLVLLYDDDLRPVPETVACCLDFHERYPQPEHARLLAFEPDPSLVNCPALHWAFRLFYPFPAESGLFDWRIFWGGTLTCKKRLFTDVQFDPKFRTLEDTEAALRISRRFDMRIHFDKRSHGTMTRRLRFQDVCRRQYMGGYFGFQLALTHPGKLDYSFAPYNDPEKYVIANPGELKGLLALAAKLEAEAIRTEAEVSPLLAGLWRRAEIHARASGWIAARDGGTQPGTPGHAVPAFG